MGHVKKIECYRHQIDEICARYRNFGYHLQKVRVIDEKTNRVMLKIVKGQDYKKTNETIYEDKING